MIYKRHYIQYNDLVFDDLDMISEDGIGVSFKVSESEYGFGHGSYVPHKRGYMFVQAGNASFTLTLKMKKLPCEERPFYERFAKAELMKPGKLWAVQDNTIVWAYAYLNGIRESQNSKKDELELDVDMALPEGVWHKADKQKTFLVPYDVCEFMNCYDFHDVQPCMATSCCTCEQPGSEKFCDCCDDCNKVTKDMALCYNLNEIQNFYARCGSGYRIVYDCAAADRLFNPMNEPIGQKICALNSPIIAGLLYSDTDIPTNGVRITIHGQMHNPYVEINGNGNYFMGDYDGYLIIEPDGSVYFTKDKCGECGPLDVSTWVVPLGADFGWEVHQGNNKVIVDTGVCCPACAYFEVDSLTY